MEKADFGKMMSSCSLCPRKCRADRLSGRTGFCGMDADIHAARAALHMWEEPCISGSRGSGTVFFSGCTLRCVFCQNYKIASGSYGETISPKRLAAIFLELQQQGAANINLVTPTHFLPQIIEALDYVKYDQLHIPVVYNTSGYENTESLKMLEGYVDIYLPDFKYMDAGLAGKYSNAPDYPETAKAALAEMVRQTGSPAFSEDGMMKKGVIVRHLMLPGQLMDSKHVVKYLYETYGDRIFMSLMNQYTPLEQVKNIPELNRTVKKQSYKKLIDYALALGVSQAFIQEGETAKESFIPDFECQGIAGKDIVIE